jgi:GntR family transcriptional regulator
MTGSQRVTGAGRAPAPVDVADAYGIEADTVVAWRERLLMVDDRAVQVCTSYYPESVVEAVPELLAPERLPANAMELMARAGYAVSDGGQDLVFARTATEDEASALGIDIGTPVTEAFRIGRGVGGQVVMVERMVSDSTRLRQVWTF